MKIDRVILGDFETNCYILRNSNNDKQCLIIDPGFSPEPLIDMLQQESIQPQRILLTHGHCDHIAGIELLKKNFGNIPNIFENIFTTITYLFGKKNFFPPSLPKLVFFLKTTRIISDEYLTPKNSQIFSTTFSVFFFRASKVIKKTFFLFLYWFKIF